MSYEVLVNPVGLNTSPLLGLRGIMIVGIIKGLLFEGNVTQLNNISLSLTQLFLNGAVFANFNKTFRASECLKLEPCFCLGVSLFRRPGGT